MSLDDLYNHLKVYETKVQKITEPNTQNTAFISSAKHSRGNDEVNTASVYTASSNVPTASANVATDINQIDEDDMEEMDIKWNMALLSMRADKFWKTTGNKISIQGSYVAGFDKSKVDASTIIRWVILQENVELPKTRTEEGETTTDREDHALVADEEAPTKFALMANTSTESKECIETLKMELETLKQEKEVVDGKLAGLLTASKDLDNLIESQRSDKSKEECADDTITDYSRPLPTIESFSEEDQNRNPSVFKNVASPITPKPFVKFVKASDSPDFVMKKKPCFNCGDFNHLAYECRKKVKGGQLGSSQNKINDKGYWDSGCSRHMTGNISYLSDYEPFNGGYVSFGQGGCKITGKETIKTECIVLGRYFKLLDDDNILVRTPRQHNMYFSDLNNIVPYRDLTCLVAKASADECMIWHRRLGHLNFKTMNKLVRHNLVRGLPTKCFENDHNCTAFLKGKQHKSSCKSKLVNSVSKPLHTLHMDLFGPTFVSSISHKWIKREFSNARTPQQNGVAERRNRSLIEVARTMLADAKLPVTF
nr:hypothetical protein [Tanacetum cinerariifolium]